MTKIYGLLEFADGTELLMEGESLDVVSVQIAGRRIVGFGRGQIGNEANVYVERADGTTQTLRNVRQIAGLFR